MSSTPVVVESVVAVVEPTVVAPTKAPKKPSLPAKYSKFLSFGFWFASRLEPETRDAFYQQFKLFSSLEEQSEFFQTYLDEASASNKIMRKTIANHNKPVKTRATKASRKTSKPVAAETDDLIATLIADANGEPLAPPADKPKKTRKPKSENTDDKPKKTKKTKASSETVAETVPETVPETLAETVVSEPVPETVSKPVAKKTTKPKAEKADKAEKPKAEKAEKPKAEKAEKPKAEKAKKTKKDTTEPVVAAPTEPLVEEPVNDESDDSIQTHTVQLNGSQYLMDSDNNLYDINSHEQIGTYNHDTQSAIMN
jgi:hypothetical protein